MSKILEPEIIWSMIRKKCEGNSFKIAMFTFGFSIIVYIQMITEWLANPDANGLLLYKRSNEWENTLGRVGLGMFIKLKGNFQFPTLQTIFCVFVLAIITVLLCVIFDICQPMWGLMFGGLMVCSPFICDLLTYYYTADAYMVAYLFSVLFVYMLIKYRNIWAFITAVILLTCSLGLYQAFLGTSITLCLLYLLYRLLKKGDSRKTILLQGGRFLAGGCSGTILYLLAYRFYCSWKNIQPTEARGFASMGTIPKERIGELIKEAYIYFTDYYFTDNLIYNSWHLWKYCNILVFLSIAAIMTILLWKKQREIQSILLTFIGLIILPLSFMSIVVMAPGASITESTGILMLPHMNFIYLFLIALVAGDSDGIAAIVWGKWITAALSSYLIFILLLYVQIFQNCMRMELNRNYALAQRIVIQVEAMPEYHQGMKLMICGEAENGNYPRSYQDWYGVVKGTVAEYGGFWDNADGRQSSWIGFFNNYLGLSYSRCSVEDITAVTSSEEYKKMPIFPEQGSVIMIDDCAVVKLSPE